MIISVCGKLQILNCQRKKKSLEWPFLINASYMKTCGWELFTSWGVKEQGPPACCAHASSLQKEQSSTFCIICVHLTNVSWPNETTFEVLDSFDSQFQGGIFVTHKNSLWVLLESGNRPHVIYAFFYRFVQSKRLVCSSDENHHLRRKWRKCWHWSTELEVSWQHHWRMYKNKTKKKNKVNVETKLNSASLISCCKYG